MNNQIIRQAAFFVLLIILQVLIFQRMTIGWGGVNYVRIFIYPLFILGLPIRTPPSAVLTLAFIMGLIVDVFYMTPGVHAGAITAMAFARPYILGILEPRTGYSVNAIPSKYHQGINWYLSYSGILLFIHVFIFYILEVFTFVYFLEIWLKTVFTFFITFLVGLIYQYLVDPKA
jgi:hypothetical protein